MTHARNIFRKAIWAAFWSVAWVTLALEAVEVVPWFVALAP